MKRLINILGFILLLFSCNNTNIYKVEGTLSNLKDATLYFVFESAEKNLIDTVVCNDKGRFSHFRVHDYDFQTITVFFNDRSQWFSLYPEVGIPIHIKGDADYPQLFKITGGQIHDKLSQFQKKAAPLLKELADIQRDSLNDKPFSDDAMYKITDLKLKIRKTVLDFIAQNPKDEASAVLFYEYFAALNDIEHTEQLLEYLSPELNDFYLVKNILKDIYKAKTTQPGAVTPEFRVTTVLGQTFTVDSFANKPFVLAFTASWCDICQAEMKILEQITAIHSKDSLGLLVISLDDDLHAMRERLQQDSVKWHLVADSAGQAIHLFDIYNVKSLPKNFLISRDGNIILNTKSGEELRQTIEKLMEN